MSSPQISAQEQLLLELINRARLDPAAEAARHGTSLGGLSAATRAPLAWNGDLAQAAAGHSAWMLSADQFSHTGAGGSSAEDRLLDAGYRLSGSSNWGENISGQFFSGSVNATEAVLAHHAQLFQSADHRANILGDFREVGLGQEIGSYGGWNGSMLTEVFAKSGTRAFVTGVAFTDRDGDRFYDVGEGRGDVSFDWLGNTGGSVETGTAGGYALAIPTGLDGWHDVTVRAGGAVMRIELLMTGGNVKLDLAGPTLCASASIRLGEGARDARLLGVASLDLLGNGEGNRLEGNAGHNVLKGGAGADRIVGGRGGDRIEGGRGGDSLTGGSGEDRFVFVDRSGETTGSDRILDHEAHDRILLDLAGPAVSERAWEDDHISRADGGWRIALGDGSSILVLGPATRAQIEESVELL